MTTIISDKIVRIIKNRKRLEKILNVRISNKGKEVTFEGSPEEEYEASKVLDALNMGFSFSSAVSIKQNEKVFEIINIKDYTKKRNLEEIRGRIIGKNGKALATLSQLTDSSIEIKENQVGIIGDPENVKLAIESIILLIQGAKHSNVYKGLEKNQPKPVYDLGLKE